MHKVREIDFAVQKSYHWFHYVTFMETYCSNHSWCFRG